MTREDFIENLKTLSSYDKVYINNEYASWEDYDSYIECMEDLDSYCYRMSPTEIINNFGDIDTNCNFWKNGWCGIDSFDDPDDYINWDCVVDWIIEQDNDFDNEDIREWLNELNGEDEDVPSGYKM